MEEQNKHIDELFRAQLGNYTQPPPPSAWSAIENRLDTQGGRKKRMLWWPLLALLFLGSSVTGYYLVKNNFIFNNNKEISVPTPQTKPLNNQYLNKVQRGSERPVNIAENNSATINGSDRNTSEANTKTDNSEKNIGSKQSQQNILKPAKSAEENISLKNRPAIKNNNESIAAKNGDNSNSSTSLQNKNSEHDAVGSENSSDEYINANKSKRQNAKRNTLKNKNADQQTNTATNGNNTTNALITPVAKSKNITSLKASQKKIAAEKSNSTIAEETKSVNKNTKAAAQKAKATDNQGEQNLSQKKNTEQAVSENASKQHKIEKIRTEKKQIIQEEGAPNGNKNFMNSGVSNSSKKSKALKGEENAQKKKQQQEENENGIKPATALETKNENSKTSKKETVTSERAEKNISESSQAEINKLGKSSKAQPPYSSAKTTKEKRYSFEEESNNSTGNAKKKNTQTLRNKNEKSGNTEVGNVAKKENKPPPAERDPRDGIAVSSYLNSSTDNDEETTKPATAKQEDKNKNLKGSNDEETGGGGGATSSSPSKPPSPFEGGIKAGYERGISNPTAGKYVGSAYVQYNISPKVALMLQPSVKAANTSNLNLSGNNSYYDSKSATTTFLNVYTDSVGGQTITHYRYNLEHHYDSVIVTQSAKTNYVEIELPLMVRYALSPTLSFMLGMNLNFGKTISITESESRIQNITLTHADTLTQNTPPSASNYFQQFHANSQPYSDYTPATTVTTNSARFGYIFGLSYTLKERILFDVLMQQSVSGINITNPEVKKIYSQPYFRISIGYKLFKGQSKPKE